MSLMPLCRIHVVSVGSACPTTHLLNWLAWSSAEPVIHPCYCPVLPLDFFSEAVMRKGSFIMSANDTEVHDNATMSFKMSDG